MNPETTFRLTPILSPSFKFPVKEPMLMPSIEAPTVTVKEEVSMLPEI